MAGGEVEGGGDILEEDDDPRDLPAAYDAVSLEKLKKEKLELESQANVLRAELEKRQQEAEKHTALDWLEESDPRDLPAGIPGGSEEEGQVLELEAQANVLRAELEKRQQEAEKHAALDWLEESDPRDLPAGIPG